MKQTHAVASLPIALWVSAALVVHFVSFKGADGYAEWWQERRELLAFVSGVRDAAGGDDDVLEVDMLPPPPKPAPVKKTEEEPKKAKKPKRMRRLVRRPTAKKKKKKTPPKKAKPAAKKPKQPKKRPKIFLKPKPKPPTPKAKPKPKPKRVKRIAVQQKVKDKKQKPNPNARFLSAHANHVKKETRARHTARHGALTASKPAHAPGRRPNPGNAANTRPGEMIKSPGRKNRPAGDRARVAKRAAQPPGANAASGGGKPPSIKAPKPKLALGGGRPKAAHKTAAKKPAITTRGDTIVVPKGSFSINLRADAKKEKHKLAKAEKRRRARGRGKGQVRKGARRKAYAWNSKNSYSMLGLGAGSGAGGINLSLSHSQAMAALHNHGGHASSKRDGERLRAKHRGSYKSPNFNKWKEAINNYVASVKPGNQTALNSKASAFATYIHRIHQQLHPIFAGSFLGSLSSMPDTLGLNDPKLQTHIEIVLDGASGSVVRMGVVKHSGITAFDVGALNAVSSAGPFGPAPEAIVSPDGRVYLHWEFHRDPRIACGTWNAFPFLLKKAPKAPSKKPPPEPKGGKK